MLIAEHGGIGATEEEEEGTATESIREMLKPVRTSPGTLQPLNATPFLPSPFHDSLLHKD